ncbi:meiotic recombination protein SPO11 [Athalia rosae]|uniref:meiotic recombination protein SPO11 n=1 Tax=Athalia rosae TaxID=37344 RepID=UPI00203447DE|nr:meiotic recombination protein SPO11 [Athalia rosae]
MTVDFRRRGSRKNLALILTVTSHVHKLLINRTSKTRRALYYELQTEPFTATLARTQRTIDAAVNHVAGLLDRAPWELVLGSELIFYFLISMNPSAFTATSKGLVSGDLTLTFSGRESVTCNAEGGVLIPQNIHRITSIRTSAKYVLVVEKDSVFQRLLAEHCPQFLNCILITGKGYPDINTRMLVSLLGNRLNIPVYVLVDADPFGVEIMCIYR